MFNWLPLLKMDQRSSEEYMDLFNEKIDAFFRQGDQIPHRLIHADTLQKRALSKSSVDLTVFYRRINHANSRSFGIKYVIPQKNTLSSCGAIKF